MINRVLKTVSPVNNVKVLNRKKTLKNPCHFNYTLLEIEMEPEVFQNKRGLEAARKRRRKKV
ncbi:hypothetical protein E2C01_042175 [Portunus trituberculatus]|uniref:Uncharacterized protein n=1 Tax=Portunus trituberculatus TaxID=210409 RepID=A0A5B7FTW8_PORTR|nr:hypothetical protein [Portunus trituberculatus]